MTARPGAGNRPRRAVSHRERGISESVQWALIWPVVIMAVVGVVQTAVVLEARATATEAARAAVRARALHGSGPGDARHAAEQVVGPSRLEDLTVSVSSNDGLIRVDVAGRAPAVLGRLLPTRVSGHAVAIEEGS